MARSNGANSKRCSLYADLDHLRTMFASVDPANTGYIGYQELRSLAQSGAGMDEAMVAVVLQKLDRDKDGKISFDDFQALFESERDSIKRQRIESGGNEEYQLVLESSPLAIVPSPSPLDESTKNADVVLRHKRPRLQREEQSHSSGLELSLAHIGRGPGDEISPVEHDLATQMQYLTNIPESPRLNRASKVLSWISESEDMFEDTGVNEEQRDGLLSPPMSPNRVSADDEIHIRSIVEAVCQTQEIGPNAVEKLCSHANADEQEQQELLALISHLDKEGRGYVSVDEFVGGLHSMCTSASVASSSTPPLFHSHGKSHSRNDLPIPQMSQPFTSTPKSSQRILAPHTSTPLPLHRKSALKGDSSQLTVLDPQNSGFVAVDTLAQQWHRMGVEPPHDQSLEEALRESLPVDASQRVCLSEVASTLETVVLNENQNHILRQAALLTYKAEINQLRCQLHQVLMERDGLQSNLQRTTEESKRLVQEGDEQVEKITRESERKARENEQCLSERLREVEREKEEEAKRLQELIDMQNERHFKELEDLRNSEDRLKRELRFAIDEAKQKNIQKQLDPAVAHHGDRLDRVDVENDEGFGIRRKFEELEQENADLLEQTKNLQEQNRSLQDRVDELMADNEKLKQEYTSHKRRLQRQHSAPHSSRLDDCRTSRPHPAMRPSSASRKSTAQFSLSSITEAPMDRHGAKNIDADTLTHKKRGLQEEIAGELLGPEAEKEGSDMLSCSSDEGLFAKSTASLLEEMQYDDAKDLLEKELEELRQTKQELEDNCSLLEAQLQQQQDRGDMEKRQLLCRHKHKQSELKKQIQSLEEQKKRLSITKEGIENQLEAMEYNLLKQLSDIHKLQNEVSSNMNSSSTSLLELTTGAAVQADQKSETDTDYQHRIHSLQHKIDVFTTEKEHLLTAHREAMDKMAEEEKKVIETETEHNKAILRLTKELKSSKMALEQYKNDAQSLEVQLNELQQEVKTKDRELQILQGKQQRKVLPILPSENKEFSRLKEEKECLLKDIQVKSAEIERMQELQTTELERYEADLERERQDCQDKLETVTKDAERKIIAFKTKMSEEQALFKMRCNIQVESTQQELKSCQFTLKKLKGIVETAEKQSEHLLFQLSQQRDAVKVKESRIEELENMQKQYQDEISSIQQDKQELELHLKEHINQLQSELQIVKSELRLGQTGVVETVPDITCSFEVQMPHTPVITSRQSFHSDLAYNVEIVSQMKEQLEDLQMCLVQQNSYSSTKNELALVQQLLEINTSLKEHLERERTERLKEIATLEDKDLQIQALARGEEEYRACLNDSILKGLERDLYNFQQQSEARLSSFSEKLKVANASVLSFIERMKKNRESIVRAETFTSDELHKSQVAEVCCRSENDRQRRKHEEELDHLVTDKKREITEFDEQLFQEEAADISGPRYPVHMKNDSFSISSGSEVHRDVTDGNETHEEIKMRVPENSAHRSPVEINNNPRIPVYESVEVLMQYDDTALQHDLMVTNKHPQDQPEQKAEIEKTNAELKNELGRSQRKIMELEQQVFLLEQTLQEKELVLHAETKKGDSEKQERTLATAKGKNSTHPQQLNSLKLQAEGCKAQLHSIYSQLGLIKADMDQIDYNYLATRAEDKIELLFKQISKEQSLRQEAEINMGKTQTEWQMQESQWLVEHEEEVRALRQRNFHLSQMLQDTRAQYHDYIADQERENSDILQDLIAKQADMESELELRTKQLSQSSITRDSKSEPKEVMLELLEQLCTQLLAPSD